MITKIGIIAGEIWQLLDKSGTMRVKDINSKIDRPEAMVLMSVGWLSREGHIILEEESGDFSVRLREKETEKV